MTGSEGCEGCESTPVTMDNNAKTLLSNMSINKIANEDVESANKYLPVRYLKISDEPRLTETYNHLTDKTCDVIGCDKEIEYFTTYTVIHYSG
jgi:hypothetical protein